MLLKVGEGDACRIGLKMRAENFVIGFIEGIVGFFQITVTELADVFSPGRLDYKDQKARDKVIQQLGDDESEHRFNIGVGNEKRRVGDYPLKRPVFFPEVIERFKGT